MKTGWRIQTLGEACVFERGLTYSKADEVTYSRNAVLRANNIDLLTNKIDLTEIRHISDDVRVPLSKKVKRGSLIICTASGSKSHLGKVAIIEDDYEYAFGGFMGQITPKPHVDPKYLFYVMTSKEYKSFISDLSNGMNINNLKFSELQTFPIVMPSLSEQNRIVAFLDKAFEGIATAVANAEKNLVNARELFDSYLNSVFSQRGEEWVQNTVAGLIEQGILSRPLDGNHGEIHPKKSEFVSKGVPFVMVSDLIEGEVDQENCNFISTEQASALRTGFAKNGDVLISHKGTIGRAAILRTTRAYVMLTPQLTYYRIIDNFSMSNQFLFYLFQTKEFQQQLSNYANEGSTRAYIGITKQLKLQVRYPGLNKQKELVAVFDTLAAHSRSLDAIYQQKVEALAELKQAILQKAFAGELIAQPEKASLEEVAA